MKKNDKSYINFKLELHPTKKLSYSTVTLFAKFLGLSTSVPLSDAVAYPSN